MYKRLLSLVNKFIYLERAHLHQSMYCQLIEVTAETIEVQNFTKDGLEDTRWIFPLGSVTGIATQSADLARLALTVKWAQSSDETPQAAVTSDV
ncbi:MAG: hypothetical protein K2X66_19185 [Cyanobacteria bacterium]|nr:hypothetical protein [Cyanobacteriota bacterium]